jgi:fatty-acid peroxygenase
MVDGFGGVGPRHWRARRARRRSEGWAEALVEEKRRRTAQDGTAIQDALSWIASHRAADGQLLDSRVAAVELLNLLRPIVAIATYIVFAALALHRYPDARRQLEREGEEYLEFFAQEVRRFYPFTPFLGARVQQEFDWQGHRFKTDELVVLDVYGTNHDPRLWPEPDEFRPERFRQWKGSQFDFIPQGGGDHAAGHRCAGEWITIESIKLALTFLTRFLAYEVPEQDLGFSLARMPTGPRSGFIISRIQIPRG